VPTTRCAYSLANNYIVDITIIDATRNLSSAAISNHKADAETEKAFNQKVDQYTKTCYKQHTTAQLRVLAADYRGGLSSCSIGYGQEIIEKEHLCKPQIPKSVLASRFFQRQSVAILRAVTYKITGMENRHASGRRMPVVVPTVTGRAGPGVLGGGQRLPLAVEPETEMPVGDD
jgi:hypothetical protein